MIVDIGSYFLKINRKIRRRHNFRDHMFYGSLRKRASEHSYAGFLKVYGVEKRKPHDMVPVGMSKNHGIVKTFFGNQPVTKPPDT